MYHLTGTIYVQREIKVMTIVLNCITSEFLHRKIGY